MAQYSKIRIFEKLIDWIISTARMATIVFAMAVWRVYNLSLRIVNQQIVNADYADVTVEY